MPLNPAVVVAYSRDSMLQAFASIGLPQRCHRVPPECTVAAENCSEPAFRRNTAARVYITEPAHNPEVAGSNPAPATEKGPQARLSHKPRPWPGFVVRGGKDDLANVPVDRR